MEKNSLWKNIRANRGSGKKPTKAMLLQERKIKKMQNGFDIFALENDEFESGDEVYNEFLKLTTDEQSQFLDYIEKAQEGSKSPRHAETPEEKKQRLAKYKKSVEQGNYNKSLYTDLDMRRSREINVPFKTKEAISSTTIPPFIQSKNSKKVIYTNKDKKSLFNVEYTPDEIDKYYANKRTFNNEFSPEELEEQFKESITIQEELAKTEKSINQFPEFIDSNTKSTNNQNFIKSDPITMDFDNPDELRAIQYRKLKNSNVLSPYRGNIDLQLPELYQESISPYLDNIKESRNKILQNINSNTSTGQSLLSGIYADSLDKENNVINEVNKNNNQNRINWLNQKANIRNRQQEFDYKNDIRYYDDVAQLQSNQDEEDINYMNSIANVTAKRQKAKNSLINTMIMEGLPNEALQIRDKDFTFDVNKIPYRLYTKSQYGKNAMKKYNFKKC